MQSYSCMLCKKSDKEFINICYKNGRNSAKDDIVELCGNSVELYLDYDDLVCSRCIRILDDAASFKRQLYRIVIEHSANRKLSNSRNASETERSDFEEPFDNNDDDDGNSSDSSGQPHRYLDLRSSPQSSLNTPMSPRNFMATSSPRSRISPNIHSGSSPNNLLIPKHSIPYDQRSDTDMEEANSKYHYYHRDTPSLDREVQRTNFRRRRRSRGHNWARRKGSQKSRSRSRSRSTTHSQQSRVSRTASRISRGTTASKKQVIQKQAEIVQKSRILSDFLDQNSALSQFTRAYLSRSADVLDENISFDKGFSENVQKPSVKTRYASELRDKLMLEYEECIYECPVTSCHEILLSLEQITEHRVKVHNEMAFFLCNQCNFSYLSQEHLDKHNTQHFQKFLSYCIYCSEEFKNKNLYEEHLNEHLIHSFPCIYCDKFFLRKQLCENHIREQHPGRKRKIKRIKPQSILDRIDKYTDGTEVSNDLDANQPEEFVVKVLYQPGQIEEPSNEDAVNEDYIVNDDDDDMPENEEDVNAILDLNNIDDENLLNDDM